MSDQQPSKTPRTDAEIKTLMHRIDGKLPPNWTPTDSANWMADFARQLETELSTANAEVNTLKDTLLQAAVKVNGLEHELAVANAEVERLKAVVKHLEILEAGDGQQFKEFFTKARKSPAYWTEAVDILHGELDISNKHRDALLTNSKALAAFVTCNDAYCGGDSGLICEPCKTLAAHNKLMEQFK